MNKALIVLLAFALSSPIAQARLVCAEFNEHPRFRSANQEVLSDGSVMFSQPEVLVRDGEYMEISMAMGRESVSAFCAAHDLRLSQSQPTVSIQNQFVEISHKRGPQGEMKDNQFRDIEIRLVTGPRLVARTIVCRP